MACETQVAESKIPFSTSWLRDLFSRSRQGNRLKQVRAFIFDWKTIDQRTLNYRPGWKYLKRSGLRLRQVTQEWSCITRNSEAIYSGASRFSAPHKHHSINIHLLEVLSRKQKIKERLCYGSRRMTCTFDTQKLCMLRRSRTTRFFSL